MILRMTFAARIGLIVVVGLGMAWISTIALYYIARAHTAESNTLPVPGHIAALVELIERTPSEERKLVLRVASSETFAARIDAGANTGTTAQRILPRLNQRAIESSLQALGGRPVSVNFADTGERRRLFARLVPPTVDVRVGLRTGDTLVIEIGNAVLLGPLDLPVGFGAGIFGTLIALLALLVMHRETKPLARLAEAVDRVDLSLDPVALPEARRSAPEIRSLIDAFNRLQNRLGELLRSRMPMLGGISHDVRTYATRLRLRAEKISDEAERDRAIADINDMILLLDDALLASRAGAGELAEEMVEIDDIIRAEVADRRSCGARIDYQGGRWEQVPIVLGDRLALRRVVANLADNAIKYGGSAHHRSMIVDKDLLLTVDDEGAGIPPEHRQAMLEPFSRLETSRSRGTGGAGLGLAIARGLVEAHRGTLSIQEAPSGGARIAVRLPLFQSH
jgi:signal transduction histidine kinase